MRVTTTPRAFRRSRWPARERARARNERSSERVPGEDRDAHAGALTGGSAISRILRLSSRNLCSSSVSSEPSSTIEPASGMTLCAIVAGNLRLRRRERACRRTRGPRVVVLMLLELARPARRRRRAPTRSPPGRSTPRSSRGPPRRAAASAPASPPWSCSWGWRRFPWDRVERVGVHLGDDQRHVGVHPPRRGVVDHDRTGRGEARAQHARGRRPRGQQHDVEPREVRGRGVFDVIWSPRHSMVDPAERDDAKKRISSTGKSRSIRIERITVPTWPVAPTMATLMAKV